MRVGFGKVALAAVAALVLLGGSAQAAIQSFNFYGTLAGTPAAFPPYLTPITGSISYDPANSGVPYNASFPDADYGVSSWSYHAVTAFNFTAGSLTGAYAGPGAGQFVVFNNNGGLDALAPTVYASEGLTGAAPAGYHLVSAGLYFYDYGRLLGGSSSLPDPISGINLGAFTGKLFSATYALDGVPGSDFTIYGQITAIPEPASWALMILGFTTLGATLRLTRRRTLATA